MPPESSFQANAAAAFLAYTVGVFLLAFLSHRLLKTKSFLSEYFLGSRGLGLWALAMTYAATSASGGSFMGFPALIYQHGWILALWIASYMIVPVCVMGILGKRLNQVGRKTGAITVPDVFRDRFRNPLLGIVTSLLLVFFLAFFLVAQFKAGALIIETLIGDLPTYKRMAAYVAWIPETFSVVADTRPSYCLALLLFSIAVITYTVYGGFRAVVWTDVFQGIIMFLGVLLLLVCTLTRVEDGLEGVTRRLADVREAAVTLRAKENIKGISGTMLLASSGDRDWTFLSSRRLSLEAGEMLKLSYRASEADLPPGGLPRGTSLTCVSQAGERLPVDVLELRYDESQNLVSGPGFSPVNPDGFLPLLLAFSYFIMWAISGAGQPTTMVRLMAFRDTKTYRRAMFSVSVYYSLIYVPLIIVFVCARSLLPELEEPDMAMPRMVFEVVHWGALAGIVLAAPFAAVMSTVDSFLLAISSCLVRDIFQRSIRPEASPRTIRRLSYATTLAAGLIVLLGAFNPPRFLQHIIVLSSGGQASSFLAPMFFALYWKRMNSAGVLCGMLGGFGVFCTLYALGWTGVLGDKGVLEPHPGGFLPLVWGLGASIAFSVLGSLCTRPPPGDLVDRYFRVRR